MSFEDDESEWVQDCKSEYSKRKATKSVYKDNDRTIVPQILEVSTLNVVDLNLEQHNPKLDTKSNKETDILTQIVKKTKQGWRWLYERLRTETTEELKKRLDDDLEETKRQTELQTQVKILATESEIRKLKDNSKLKMIQQYNETREKAYNLAKHHSTPDEIWQYERKHYSTKTELRDTVLKPNL